jgi:hypothetical protein
MWQAFMDWLPDLRVGAFEIRDVLSLGMTGLGAYLAWQAIKMGREQSRIAQEQADIAKRQAAIVENQDHILREQLAKKTDLRVSSGSQKQIPKADQSNETLITLTVRNGGNKIADGFYWELMVPDELCCKVELTNDGGAAPGQLAAGESGVFNKLSGHYTDKLFPTSRVEIGKLAVDCEHPATERFWIEWRIGSEDGGVPAEGHARIHYRRMSDGFFAYGTSNLTRLTTNHRRTAGSQWTTRLSEQSTATAQPCFIASPADVVASSAEPQGVERPRVSPIRDAGEPFGINVPSGSSELYALRLGPRQTCFDPLLNPRPLELRDCAEDVHL